MQDKIVQVQAHSQLDRIGIFDILSKHIREHPQNKSTAFKYEKDTLSADT